MKSTFPLIVIEDFRCRLKSSYSQHLHDNSFLLCPHSPFECISDYVKINCMKAFAMNYLPTIALLVVSIGPIQSLPYTSWLSQYQGTRIVDLPVIPGTHNSGAITLGNNSTWQAQAMWDYAQTQNSSIANQLSLGIRMLDLRLHVMYNDTDYPNQIRISHTYDSNITLADVLSSVKDFLDQETTEFVIMYLRIDSFFPLMGNVTAKQSFIESTLADSGISFASYTAGALKSLTVGDVAGQVLLMGIPGDAFKSSGSMYSFIDSDSAYSVCDIWEVLTITAAQSKLSNCFPEVPATGQLTGMLTGYAIDGQLDGLPPVEGSIEMNNWFFNNFMNNPAWTSRKQYPIGVLLIDFAVEDYMATVIDYATTAEVSINYQNNTITAKESEKTVMVPWQFLLVLTSIVLLSN